MVDARQACIRHKAALFFRRGAGALPARRLRIEVWWIALAVGGGVPLPGGMAPERGAAALRGPARAAPQTQNGGGKAASES